MITANGVWLVTTCYRAVPFPLLRKPNSSSFLRSTSLRHPAWNPRLLCSQLVHVVLQPLEIEPILARDQRSNEIEYCSGSVDSFGGIWAKRERDTHAVTETVKSAVDSSSDSFSSSRERVEETPRIHNLFSSWDSDGNTRAVLTSSEYQGLVRLRYLGLKLDVVEKVSLIQKHREEVEEEELTGVGRVSSRRHLECSCLSGCRKWMEAKEGSTNLRLSLMKSSFTSCL